MVEYIIGNYVKYYLGGPNIYVHLDAVHAHPPESDAYTGEIVEGVIKSINCSGIIALVSRTVCDLNRERDDTNKEGIDEYRNAVSQILKHLKILDLNNKVKLPYLHLAIHGVKNKNSKNDIILWFSKWKKLFS